ncbi:MAG: TlpA family protein disulfide reductase [Saprospiraceae bacterium]|nr:TlpA family protein disulfide reductase [Saprospiraceae bacterium]
MRNSVIQFSTWIIGIVLLLSASGCLVIDNSYPELPPGPWRGILKLESNQVNSNHKGEPLPDKLALQFEEVTQGQLPFNFEVSYSSPEKMIVTIRNGEERIVLEDVEFGHDLATGDDTVRIDIPVYDSYLRGKFASDVIEGEWVATNRGDYRIPFVAYYGKNHRFTELKKKPITDLTGRWEVQFDIESDSPYPGIADFVQTGNTLTGTFLTETGDYRFLEGTVQGDKMYLSAFDGSHAFLFEAKLMEDQRLLGSFKSGSHYQSIWQAKRNSNAALRDVSEMTKVREGQEYFRVVFEDEQGQIVDTDAPPYAGKPMFVQVFGSWCPNCKDEIELLVEWLQDNPEWPGEGLGLAFERYKDPKKSWKAIQTVQEKLNVPYTMVLAGNSSKSTASEALPMLDGITAYPTLILLNKDHKVEHIYTGINGPATREYQSFKADLAKKLENLASPDQ